VAVILSVSLTIVVSWTAIRIGLILPAAAIGGDLTIKQSWAATAPVSAAILAPLCVIGLSTTIVNGAIVAMFQGPILGAGLQVAVYWIQILLNLSLMTTLYGHRIHGRPLN
jgi:cytochrome c oxidase subunit IV